MCACVCSSFLAITLAASIFAWLINRSENIFFFLLEEKNGKNAIGRESEREKQTRSAPKINFVILCEFFFYFRYAFVLNNSKKKLESKTSVGWRKKANQQIKSAFQLNSFLFFVSLFISFIGRAMCIDRVLVATWQESESESTRQLNYGYLHFICVFVCAFDCWLPTWVFSHQKFSSFSWVFPLLKTEFSFDRSRQTS